MSVRRARQVRFYRTFSLLGVVAVVGAITGITLSGGQSLPSVRGVREGGDARLVSIDPLPDGPMCEYPPSASSSLAATLSMPEEESQSTPAEGAPDARPSDAAKAEAAKRAPEHVIRDPHTEFSGLAVDLANNEVVLTDENQFRILSYDRLTNTPPKANMSEPKRIIAGTKSYLEFNCSVYVDPNNGDIYSVNNDTLNWLTIFDRSAKGDMAPTRKLRAPHTVFGIAVDEEKQEMLLTDQDDHAVVVFKKSAKDEDSPIRVLQGSKTQLADPHGIALDTKTKLIFVTNWGSAAVRPELGSSDAGELPSFGGVARTLWPVARNLQIPGSGMLQPPSITVYPEDASGNTPPLQVIQGSKTGLDWPTAVAVDSEHGEMFVANDTADSVSVFSTAASGNVAPIRVIKGPKSMVKNPTGIAYDLKHEELWVANFGNHTATVYKRTAEGDAPPLRVVRSAPVDAPSPMLGNPHTIAYDTKRDNLLVSN